MYAIVAATPSWGIGRNGALLFSLKEDMKYFRQTTLGKTVIMGRKTLESFPGGQPLKNRRNIVISHYKSFEAQGAETVHSVDEALELVKDLPEDEVFVIGGGEIYRQLLPYCSRVYVTMIGHEPEVPAEVHFPNLFADPDWTLTKMDAPIEEDGTFYRFCIWERVRN